MASGRISRRIRVRVPQPGWISPAGTNAGAACLLLADRVVDLNGEPNGMGLGSIITETDVTPEAWYTGTRAYARRDRRGSFRPSRSSADFLAGDLIVSTRASGYTVLLGCELTFQGESAEASARLCATRSRVDGHSSHGNVRMFSFSLRLQLQPWQAKVDRF